jgi:hypothetical protein
MRSVSSNPGIIKNEPDIGIGEDVLHGVEAVVAWPVWNCDRAIIQHLHEAGPVAARRHVRPAALPRSRDAEERRARDVVAGVAIQHSQRFLRRQPFGMPVKPPQVGNGRDLVQVGHRAGSPCCEWFAR